MGSRLQEGRLVSAEPFQPFYGDSVGDRLRAERAASYYASHGVTQQIVEESGGFVWAFYQHGQRVPGGLQALDALRKQ